MEEEEEKKNKGEGRSSSRWNRRTKRNGRRTESWRLGFRKKGTQTDEVKQQQHFERGTDKLVRRYLLQMPLQRPKQ